MKKGQFLSMSFATCFLDSRDILLPKDSQEILYNNMKLHPEAFDVDVNVNYDDYYDKMALDGMAGRNNLNAAIEDRNFASAQKMAHDYDVAYNSMVKQNMELDRMISEFEASKPVDFYGTLGNFDRSVMLNNPHKMPKGPVEVNNAATEYEINQYLLDKAKKNLNGIDEKPEISILMGKDFKPITQVYNY